jgi:hypothetical protein
VRARRGTSGGVGDQLCSTPPPSSLRGRALLHQRMPAGLGDVTEVAPARGGAGPSGSDDDDDGGRGAPPDSVSTPGRPHIAMAPLGGSSVTSPGAGAFPPPPPQPDVDAAAAHGCAPADELTKLRILWGDINPPPPELGLSEGAVDFVMSLLQSDPAARPTAAGALQHAWLLGGE